MSRKITWSEVAQHRNKGKDIWLVIENAVIDVSSYLDDHPGGPIVLESRAGTDATKSFQDSGHSKNAILKMKTLQIGVIDPESMPLDFQKRDGKGFNIQYFGLVLIALIAVLSVWQILQQF